MFAFFFFSKEIDQAEVMDVPFPNTANLVHLKPQVIVVSFRFTISFLQGFILGVVTSVQFAQSVCAEQSLHAAIGIHGHNNIAWATK